MGFRTFLPGLWLSVSLFLLFLSAIIPLLIIMNLVPFGWLADPQLANRAQVAGVAVGFFGVAATVAAIGYAAHEFRLANPAQQIRLLARRYADGNQPEADRVEFDLIVGEASIADLIVHVRLDPPLKSANAEDILAFTSAEGWMDYQEVPDEYRDYDSPLFGWDIRGRSLAPTEVIPGPRLEIRHAVPALKVTMEWVSERGVGPGKQMVLARP